MELVSVESPVIEIVVVIVHAIHFQLLFFLTTPTKVEELGAILVAGRFWRSTYRIQQKDDALQRKKEKSRSFQEFLFAFRKPDLDGPERMEHRGSASGGCRSFGDRGTLAISQEVSSKAKPVNHVRACRHRHQIVQESRTRSVVPYPHVWPGHRQPWRFWGLTMSRRRRFWMQH